MNYYQILLIFFAGVFAHGALSAGLVALNFHLERGRIILESSTGLTLQSVITSNVQTMIWSLVGAAGLIALFILSHKH